MDIFASFVDSLQDEKIPHAISPLKFGQRMGLQAQAIADAAHVHRNTVRQYPASAQLQRYMRDSLRVTVAAAKLRGDMDKAIYWCRNVPISELGHRTAEELVAAGKAEAVISYLDSIASGATG